MPGGPSDWTTPPKVVGNLSRRFPGCPVLVLCSVVATTVTISDWHLSFEVIVPCVRPRQDVTRRDSSLRHRLVDEATSLPRKNPRLTAWWEDHIAHALPAEKKSPRSTRRMFG